MNFFERDHHASEELIQVEMPMEGSSKVWNSIWERMNKKFPKACLFTRGKTKTIYEFWQRAYAKDLQFLINDKGYKDFLELGAGRGTTSMYLNDAGYNQITLIDLSAEARNIAITNFKTFQLSFKDYILADVRKTPFSDESFDCVYNIGLLEHFEQPEEVLKEAYRLLRSGGLIFMPIFPDSKSPHCYLVRLLFNPLSYLKVIFKGKTNRELNMIRTKLSIEDYSMVCRSLGFGKVECLYYNPFPKIVRDGWYENVIVLKVYKWVHFLRQLSGRKLKFQTSSFFGSAYLLVAYK